MSRFVILDPSLDSMGGHHFDYDYHTVCAAEELGYATVLATYHRFDRADAFPDSCQVLPTFRYHTYNRYSELASIRDLQADETKAKLDRRQSRSWFGKLKLATSQWIDQLKRNNPRSGRQRRIKRFAKDVARLFATIGVEPNDHVFVPTLSEIELLGLAGFLEDRPNWKQVDWHLQFHFNVFNGTEADYDSQSEQADRIRGHFASALEELSSHRVHFYTTSEPLARQYQRLQVAQFEPLAYPINPRFQTARSHAPSSPLRITLAGIPREEKGTHFVEELVDDVSTDLLETGQAKFVVQSQNLGGSDHPSVECVPYPLELDAYVQLIQSADVGLLLHDRERYYVRRAGVLGEMLAAGVPVVVPASCWLSEQISESIYEHFDTLIDEIAEGRLQRVSQADVSDEKLIVPENATDVIVELPSHPSHDVEFVFEQFDESGQSIDMSRTICSPRSKGSMFAGTHLTGTTSVIQLRCQAAFQGQQTINENMVVHFIDASDRPTGHIALGQVGIIVAGHDQIAASLREMVNHYDHYQQTAKQFSTSWFARHDPKETIRQLTSQSTQPIEANAA